jgi:hypothetical protein
VACAVLSQASDGFAMFESFPLAIPGADNPYFSAGFGLGILGSGLAALRGSAKMAATLAQRHLLVTLEVTSKDKAYPWVLQWLTAQARPAADTRCTRRTRCFVSGIRWREVGAGAVGRCGEHSSR